MTSSERFQRVKRIFVDALQQPAEVRHRFVKDRCGDSIEIQEEVFALLADHDPDGGIVSGIPASFVADAVSNARPTHDSRLAAPADAGCTWDMPDRIGPYRIRKLLGEGGMGVVFLADQTVPVKRTVALKLMKSGINTREVLARFELERQALALMNHPNVAGVLDAGETAEGRPYFVLEYVPGEPITTYCDNHRLSLRERLRLFTRVCFAIHHAHQKGVIHRDVKPQNVLVMSQDDQPAPKVIDFGIAKALDHGLTGSAVFTEYGALVGTPAYMSPEQADVATIDIDIRTDVYSLGVLLYELLTGTQPFEPELPGSAGMAAMQRLIREVEPPKPSKRLSGLVAVGGPLVASVAASRRLDQLTLCRQLRGDLDWITMKALEKDRNRRYGSASDLASDIQRHLCDEPVDAGPPSVGYRFRKFGRRHRGAVIAVSFVFLALTVGFMTASIQYSRAESRKNEAIVAQGLAQRRADELQAVTELQRSLFRDISSEIMGRQIVDKQRESLGKWMAHHGASPDEISGALESFDDLLSKVNSTDVAVEILDTNLLSGAVGTIESEFADQPLVRAALLQTVTDMLEAIGRYQPAMQQQRAVLAIYRRELGSDASETLHAINNVAYLHQGQGQLTEAKRLFREALDGFRRVFGDDHPDTLSSVNNMGFLLQLEGDLNGAERYYAAALDGRREILGDLHEDTLRSLNCMGYLMQARGRNDEAIQYNAEVLKGRRQLLGDDHPDTLTSIHNMGHLMKLEGRLEEAERYYNEALDGRRRVLGNDHPQTLNSLNSMAGLLRSMGQSAEAERYCAEAVQGLRRALGQEHANTIAAINMLGGLLNDLGRYEEARTVLEKSSGDARAAWAVARPEWFGSFLVNLGEAQLGTGDYVPAEATLLKAHSLLADARPSRKARMDRVCAVLVTLYTQWHEVEPGQGHDQRAAQWRERLMSSGGSVTGG